MKPAWDKLGDEYAGSSSVLIGDVDCTEEDARPLCEQFGIQGYPTIKYFVDGDTATGEDYQGGRDFESLKRHVVDNLEVKCLVSNPSEGCTEKEIGYITKMKGKTADDWKKQLDRLDGMKGGSMKPELKQWLVQRLNILKQLDSGASEEL
mmetsp:Transcript_20515/g.29755  ORF Transcript_20515/g.29755 Transcript_20515/m.29755 type:complete len:150 (-) Transcript_20515:472-921(-)